jgi:hypothetical protein
VLSNGRQHQQHRCQETFSKISSWKSCRKYLSSYILECHIIHLLFTKAFSKLRLLCRNIHFGFCCQEKFIFFKFCNKNHGLKFVSSQHTGISVTRFCSLFWFFINEWKAQWNGELHSRPNVSTLQSVVFIMGGLKLQRGFLIYTHGMMSSANKMEEQ